MKKLLYLTKLFLIIGTSLKLNAQSKILVLDKETNKPISFATIIYKDNLGTFTNEKGMFLLDKNFEELAIKSIAYKELVLNVKEIKDTVWMLPEPINLEPVLVTPLSKKISSSKVKMKTNNNFSKSFLSFVGNEIATLILGNLNAKKSYLTNIKIPIHSSILRVSTKDTTKGKEVNDSFCSVFQIQFYENKNGQPGQLLNYEPIIIKINQKDDNYSIIDFSEKKIIVPKEGIFFGFLAIGRADENGNLLLENPYKEKLTKNGLIRLGVAIRPLIPITEDLELNNTFIRYRFRMDGDKSWFVLDKYSFSDSTTKDHKILNFGIGYELKNFD